MRYRRAFAEGGTYFFTVNLADRSSDLLVTRIDNLRAAFNNVRADHPFETVAMVVMPDHLHAIWQLPDGDANYPIRWSLIKGAFSRALPNTENIREARAHKRERGIWQRRYWEHLIRDDDDLRRHVDYIHFNPVKHGHAMRAADWSYSTIHRFIERGWVSEDWGCSASIDEHCLYGE